MKIPIFIFLIAVSTQLEAQNSDLYNTTYTYLNQMLSDKTPLNFKKAVFSTENTYLENQLDESRFQMGIHSLLGFVNAKLKFVSPNENGKDASVINKYSCIFKTITDTTFIALGTETMFHPPYLYDFEDMFGAKDWSNMFVTKLLATHKGNCHSMPYLYKILCEELGLPCHLALSPNHIYIALWDDMTNLYNKIYQLGFRTMPEKMYVDWLVSLKKEREKYGNKQLMEMNKEHHEKSGKN
jgi:hypothetical protein